MTLTTLSSALRWHGRALAPVLAALCAASSWAQTAPTPPAAAEPVGYVKTVSGSAFVVGTQAQPAAVGMPIYLGNTLRTGAKSALGVTLVDDTVMSVGPSTELKVDEYTYVPAEGRLGLAASLVRGTLLYISGVIAKLRPESVIVKTPSGVIGVRGTQFVAKVQAEDAQP